MLFSRPKPPQWDIATYLARHRERIEERLASLPLQVGKSTLALEAMRYALGVPGKRFRPLLVLATADIYHAGGEAFVLDAAAAVECVHTASLIFDDLPCMDDATLRRGKKPTHLVYGEEQALLAGMSLIGEANVLMSRGAHGRKGLLQRRLEAVQLLNQAYAVDGLSGGQSDDLLNKTQLTLEELEYIHAKKTGALFIACTEIPAVLCGATSTERACLVSYAKSLGLAFQIQDDLLDLQAAGVTGKDAGKDAHKTTFVDLAGVEKSTLLYNQLIEVALENLTPFAQAANHLIDLTRIIQKRKF